MESKVFHGSSLSVSDNREDLAVCFQCVTHFSDALIEHRNALTATAFLQELWLDAGHWEAYGFVMESWELENEVPLLVWS